MQFSPQAIFAAFVGWFPSCEPQSCIRPHRAETSGITPHNKQPESASHHRLRPKRACARTLLRVAAGKPTAGDKQKVAEATEAFKRHHGSQPPSGAMGSDVKNLGDTWTCHGTKVHKCNARYLNGVDSCMACGSQPPIHVWARPGKSNELKGRDKGVTDKPKWP